MAYASYSAAMAGVIAPRAADCDGGGGGRNLDAASRLREEPCRDAAASSGGSAEADDEPYCAAC